MGKYLLKRLIAVIPVMFIVSTIVFILMRLAPGNPAAMMLGPEATAEEIEQLSRQLGLHRPIPVQYINWLMNIVKGDLGTSLFYSGQPVTKVVFEHFTVTLGLTIIALFLAAFIGIFVGVIASVNHNRLLDRIVMLITSAGVAMPNFWLGLLLALFFAIIYPIFPPSGYASIAEGIQEYIKYLVLPAVTLAFGQASLLARMTRANMLEVLQDDYIRTAKAKGLTKKVIIFKHALKNSLVSTITVLGLSFANLMGGAVVTEQIFNIPGIGRLLIQSVFTRDYPVVEGIVLYIAAAWVIINLIVDIVYSLVDPRIKY